MNHPPTARWRRVSMLAIGALAAGTAIGLAPAASAAPQLVGSVPDSVSSGGTYLVEPSDIITALSDKRAGSYEIKDDGLHITNTAGNNDPKMKVRVVLPLGLNLGDIRATPTLSMNYTFVDPKINSDPLPPAVILASPTSDTEWSFENTDGSGQFYLEADWTDYQTSDGGSVTPLSAHMPAAAEPDSFTVGTTTAPAFWITSWALPGNGTESTVYGDKKVTPATEFNGKGADYYGAGPVTGLVGDYPVKYAGLVMDQRAGEFVIHSLTVSGVTYTFSKPTISGTTTESLTAGQSKDFSVADAATLGVPPYTYASADKPGWVTLNTDGTFTASPSLNDYGTFTFHITATDSAEQKTPDGESRTVTLTVDPADPTLKLSAATLTGTVGKAISPITATATPGKNPLAFSAANLPAGLAINGGNGQITGTPTKAGAGTFTVTVKDAAGKTASATVVYAFNSAAGLSINVDRTVTGTAGTTIDPITVKPIGGNAPYTVKVDGLPAGLGYDAASGTITGAPKAAGTGTITVTSTDADGNVATAAITYKFAAAAPVCTTTRELKSNVSLKAGQRLKTCNGTYSFVMQGDGNLVMYKNGKATFSTRTVGKGGVRFVAQSDGSMVMYNKAGKAVWFNRAGIPKTSPVQKLTLNESGKLVLTFKNSKTYTWTPKLPKK